MNAMQPRTREKLSLGARKPTQPKQKGWSHQNWLQLNVGRQVMVVYNDGEYDKGVVVNVDQFTLLIRTETDCERLIFKSAISSIEPQERV